jgi:hypothetical protein
MAVERMVVERRGPFWRGYERLDGVLRLAVDPDDAHQKAIVDLGRAPRGGDGRVRFEADFCLLRPERPSGRLLVSVVNRGRAALVPFSVPSAPPSPEPTTEIDVGDAFLLGRGWTILLCGWQWDVPARRGLLGLRAPLAKVPPGQVVARFQPFERHDERFLSHWPLGTAVGRQVVVHRPYPPTDGPAALSVRDAPGDPPREIPVSRWRLSSDGERIRLDGGFEPGRLYELVYTTSLAPVVGCGLLAIRDAAAHLGRDADATFGYGVSQNGRFLRQLLFEGMNRTEDDTAAFQGLLPHVAGARRGEFNHRFAQPSVLHTPGFGHLPPFDTGLLVERAGAPVKVIETSSSAEYWRGDAALCHTGHPDVRQYLLCGTMHLSGRPAVLYEPPDTPGLACANPLNMVDATPLLRAALVNLEAWVCEGIEPPESLVPAVPVPREGVLERFDGMPTARPSPDRLPVLRSVDLGPQSAVGVARFPAVEGEPIRSGVSPVDDDGNELEGIRLPYLTVPLATYTGWNPSAVAGFHPGTPVDMMGSTIPFPPTPSAGEARGDPRRSIAERYGGRDDLLSQTRAAADRLVGQRLLLAQDVEAVVARAGELWDLLADGTVYEAGRGGR